MELLKKETMNFMMDSSMMNQQNGIIALIKIEDFTMKSYMI